MGHAATLSLLRFAHIVGLMVMSAGLIGVFIMDMRSRQLENVVFQTMIELPADEQIRRFVEVDHAVAATPADFDADRWTDLDSALEAFERRLLTTLHGKYRSSRKLAERLNTSHSTIARKLRKYAIR